MAKLPKKKLSKAAKPVAPKSPPKSAKAAAKSKVAAKPKVVAKAKSAAKPKASAKPAAKSAPTAKTGKTATKSKSVTKTPTKAPKKPTKPYAVQSLLDLDSGLGGPTQDGIGGGGGSTPAAPHIDEPLGGAVVPAGANLDVKVSTNRTDLSYIIEVTDITGPGPARMPVLFPVAAPVTNPFTGTIPGTNLLPGRTYRIRVLVDPSSGMTPPHAFHSITVTT